jgi:hypothetical protein
MLEAVTAYVRRKQWVMFSLVALFLAVDFGRWLFQPASSIPGFGLALEIASVVAAFYLLSRRDFFGYTVIAVGVVLALFSAAMWLVIFINNFGVAYAFGYPRLGIENYFRVALIIVSIPTLSALFAVWQPLYRERAEIRKLTDTGLVNRYVDEARALYRFSMQRDAAGQKEAFRKLSLIYYEVNRRDPTCASLYALLKEPDDFVRITVARQLLSKKNDTALNVLDAIARQHSEWSGHAQRMAAQWRKGELKAWG